MKVLEERDSFLSDYEVLQFLTHMQRKNLWDEASLEQLKNQKNNHKGRRPYNNPELQRITREMVDYLSYDKNSVPQGQDDDEEKDVNMDTEKSNQPAKSTITRMNDEQFCKLMRSLNEFDLFQAEKLQIVNHLPTNMAHLYSIVEECETRFDEQQIEKLLEIIGEFQ